MLCALAQALQPATAAGQVQTFPYVETFDSCAALPPGWSSTRTRHPLENDAAISTSTPRSAPNCVLITNATVAQALTSPLFVFPPRNGADLSFYTRRSSSFGATVILELSADSGRTFRTAAVLPTSGGSNYVPSMATLDSVLPPGASVVLRWRVRPDSAGSTGTFRLDDVTITPRPFVDAALMTVRLSNGPPPATVIVEAGVRNAGRETVEAFIVEGYDDVNANGDPEPSERFAWGSAGPLAPGDTSFHRLSWIPGSAGHARLIMIVQCPDDGNTTNDRKDTTFSTGTPRGSVVVNEIMYAPVGDEPEWVEILNPGPAPVSVSGWAITDANVGSKHPWARSSVLVPGGGSLVLCRDSAWLVAARGLDPGHVLPVTGFPSLNNAGDAVVLFDERAQVVDSVYYLPSWSAKPGVSLERIDALGESVRADNWGSCADSAGATPGAPNSIVRMDNDLSVRRLGSQERPGSREVVLTIRVRNEGRLPAGDFLVRFVGLQGGAGPIQLAEGHVSSPVGPGDSLDTECTWEDPPPGSHLLEGSVEWNPDGRCGNNRMEIPVWIPFPRGPLCISEIMSAPFTGDAEYIEVATTGEGDVDLRDWTANGRPLASGRNPVVLRQGGFAVIASDSGIYRRFPGLASGECAVRIAGSSLGLDNDADTVILRDPRGIAGDSLRYESSWHNPLVGDRSGRSLEKIYLPGSGFDRKNWSTCLNGAGGTPGALNSLRMPEGRRGPGLTAAPNPFSPDADGFDDFTILCFDVPVGVVAATATVFDARGRTVRHLAAGQPVSGAGEIVWDGLDDRGRRLPIGPYVALIEGADAQGSGQCAAKCVVVIARRL
jgi:hypothetical protein